MTAAQSESIITLSNRLNQVRDLRAQNRKTLEKHLADEATYARMEAELARDLAALGGEP